MKWLIDFPFEITINKKAIDSAVRSFSVKHDAFFSAITSGLNGLIGGIHSLLNIIPWWLFILAIFCGMEEHRKLKTAFFALAITVIGMPDFGHLCSKHFQS